MSKVLSRYIESNPLILNGDPVIVGTRIPVKRVSALLKQGYSVDMLLQEYPWVQQNRFRKAIAYLIDAGLNVYEETQTVQTSA